jgi:hypothetical protein
MNGLFDLHDDDDGVSLLTIYLRYTHLDILVLANIVQWISKIHQTIVGTCNNTFMLSDLYKDGVRNILQFSSINTGTSMTLKIKEGWAPAFQPERDDFLVELPKSLGIPAIIAYLLVSAIDKMITDGNAFLEEKKRDLETHLFEDAERGVFFNSLQQSVVKENLDENIASFIQGVKSIDAVRSISVNGVNVLSFDFNRRKYKRYFTAIPTHILSANETHAATVINISQGGCVIKINDPEEIKTDRHFQIKCTGFELEPAEISTWHDNDRSFIRAIFNPPLEESVFKAILNQKSQAR